MHTFTTAKPQGAIVRTMLAQRAETYAYLEAVVRQHRAKTFKDPATAAAVVAELGRDAAAAFAWDAATVAYLNAVGPSLGKEPVPAAVPDGYAFTANPDGTGTIAHAAPTEAATDPTPAPAETPAAS